MTNKLEKWEEAGMSNWKKQMTEIEPAFDEKITIQFLERLGFRQNIHYNPSVYYKKVHCKNHNFDRNTNDNISIEVFAKSAYADEHGVMLLRIGYSDDCNYVIHANIQYVYELMMALQLAGLHL